MSPFLLHSAYSADMCHDRGASAQPSFADMVFFFADVAHVFHRSASATFKEQRELVPPADGETPAERQVWCCSE